MTRASLVSRDMRRIYPTSRPRPDSWSTIAAYGIALSLSVRTPFASWLTVGAAMTVLIAPVVARHWFSSVPARILTLLLVAAIISGLLLTAHSLSTSSSRSLDVDFLLLDIGSLVGLGLMSAGALWSISKIGYTSFLSAWAIGFLPVSLISSELLAANPWKFALSLPVSLLILILARRNSWSFSIGIAIVVGISGIFGYRSWMFIALAALGAAFALMLGESKVGAVARFIRIGIVTALAGVLTFNLVLAGALGASVQARTLQQIQWGGGNIILGGRVEWGAALDSFWRNPIGFGLGVGPDSSDFVVAIRGQRVPSGLQEVTNVAEYLDGGRIEFHSTLWNFWSHYGLVGILLVVVLAAFFLLAALRLPQLVGSMTRPITFLMVAVFWDLLFSATVIVRMAPIIAISIAIISTAKEVAPVELTQAARVFQR